MTVTKNLDHALPSSGLVLVDKPTTWTSHDVVSWVRRRTGVKRVGHAGTLDPLATGLLIVLVGRDWTKRQSEFIKQDKEY
jgi:tRNA pseudouridine55 synthase